MKYGVQALLLSALLRFCGSRTSSSFTPSRSVCPGEQVQFNCTVVDDGRPIHGYTYWNISTGREICVLAHFVPNHQDRCGSFTAQLYPEELGLENSCFPSSFTAIARTELNNSLVQCLGPNASHLVGSDTLKIISPPSSPLLKLPTDWITETEDPDAYNVTLQWDLPGSVNDDYSSVSRYLVTVVPEVLLCGGSGRCVVTPEMEEFALRKFTFTMRVGQTYSVTIQSDNCDNSQSGQPSSPYHITLQRPAVTTNCTSCAVYNYSSNKLMSIDTQWDAVPPANDIAPGLSASVREYEIMFQSDGGQSVTEKVQSSSGCTMRTCTHNFIPGSTNDSSYHISIAARNAVTLGQRRTCNWKSLRSTNNLLQVEMVESGSSVTVQCRLLPAFNERAHCEVWYGTDPTHHVLPYHDVSDSPGTGGDVLTIHLSHNLQHNSTYYSNISLAAVNGNLCTKVMHSFRIDCDPTLLGSLVSTSDATCRRAESSLKTEHGSVCYTGRMRGALAYYTCDAGYQLAVGANGNSATQLRVCQENGRWNGTEPMCVPLEGGTTAVAALRVSDGSIIAVAAFVIGVLSSAVVYCCIVIFRTRQRQRSKHCCSDPLHPAPPLPPRQQQQKKGEVDYEEVSVVVADGGSGSVEMKTNVAYGPVSQN